MAKKTVWMVLLAAIVALPLLAASAQDPVVLFFYAEGCPDCMAVEELLTALIIDLPESALQRYEISDPKAAELLAELKDAYGIEEASVPIVFVGDNVAVGAGRAQEFKLRDAIGRCVTLGCPSPLARIRPPVSVDDLLWLALFAAVFVILAVWQLHHR